MAEKLIFGCGYLGRRVARQWVAAGNRVFALTRSPEHAASLAHEGITPGIGDVLDPDSLCDLLAVDTVLYCVGQDRTLPISMWEMYVEGLRNVLVRLPAPSRFVYISSTSVYGQRSAEWVDEMSPTEPTEEAGRVIVSAERVLRQLLPAAIILRFAGIYGPGRILRRPALEQGVPIATDPDGWLNLIHVEDGVRAILAAEELGRDGATYNVCDDRPVQRREFYTHQARLLHALEPRFKPPLLPENNRRILNHKMKAELGVELQFPNYQKGIPACLDTSILNQNEPS